MNTTDLQVRFSSTGSNTHINTSSNCAYTLYQRAEQLLPWNLHPKLKNRTIEPHWLDAHQCWFKRDLDQQEHGYEYVLLNSLSRVEAPLFDHQRLADALSTLLEKEINAASLPIDDVRLGDAKTLKLKLQAGFVLSQWIILDTEHYHCAWQTGIDDNRIKAQGESLPLPSPNGLQTVYSRHHNLYLYDFSSQSEQPLTQDGELHYGYGIPMEMSITDTHSDTPLPPMVLWSPDSRYLAVQRIDERQVSTMPLQQCVPTEGVRPVNRPYKIALPGDTHIPQVSVCIVDVQTQQIQTCEQHPIPVSADGFMETSPVFWGSDHRVYFVEGSRDRKIMRLVAFDAISGARQLVIEEKGEGMIEPCPYPLIGPFIFHVIPEHNEVIWYSHRSGWGHLYRYKLSTGELLNPITTGHFTVTELHHIDQEQGIAYFTACGREPNRNLYYEHLYRINLDGSGLVLLTPENGQHDIVSARIMREDFRPHPEISGVSPGGYTFIDTVSTLDQPPKTVLRSLLDGAELMTLAHCDASGLSATPYTVPLSFSAKAADGTTDLWGVIYRPSDFDDSQSYPVVLALYGAPHVCIVRASTRNR